MDYTKATKEQLWTILRADASCPLPLLEGAFREALDRGLIQQFIISVIKKKRINQGTLKILKTTYEDLVQVGYEAALKTVRIFEPGRGRTFTSFLFLVISQALGKLFEYVDADKRKGEETSYQALFSDSSNDTLAEYYLLDRRTNVEQTVIKKLLLEEKLSVLNDIQLETFKRVFVGYTLDEIAEQMNSKKGTVQARLQRAFIKMTGHKVNLSELGAFERRYNKMGA